VTRLDLLADDLLKWLNATPDGVPRRLLLWLDPDSQFRRLLPHLEPALEAHGVRLFGNEPPDGASHLHLKMALSNGTVPIGYLLIGYLLIGWLSTLYGASVAVLIGALLGLKVTASGVAEAETSGEGLAGIESLVRVYRILNW
jgi:hypothetical protein